MKTWKKAPKMSRDQWLSWRRTGIGGSDAPAIMGVSPYKTPFEVWEEKVLGKQQGDNAAKKYGRDNEEISRKEFEKILGVSVFPVNTENLETPWLKSSVDGLDMDGKIAVEIKQANEEDHETAKSKRVPLKYVPQCQHILRTLGLDGMYYFSMHKGDKALVEVSRDKAYIDDSLFPELKKFWSLIERGESPGLSERDYVDMVNNADWKFVAKKWKEAKKVLDEAEDIENQLRKNLIALSTDRNAQGHGVKLSKSIVKGSINYMQAFKDYIDNIRAHYPEVNFPDIVFDPYRKDPFTKWSPRVIE